MADDDLALIALAALGLIASTRDKKMSSPPGAVIPRLQYLSRTATLSSMTNTSYDTQAGSTNPLQELQTPSFLSNPDAYIRGITAVSAVTSRSRAATLTIKGLDNEANILWQRGVGLSSGSPSTSAVSRFGAQNMAGTARLQVQTTAADSFSFLLFYQTARADQTVERPPLTWDPPQPFYDVQEATSGANAAQTLDVLFNSAGSGNYNIELLWAGFNTTAGTSTVTLEYFDNNAAMVINTIGTAVASGSTSLDLFPKPAFALSNSLVPKLRINAGAAGVGNSTRVYYVARMQFVS